MTDDTTRARDERAREGALSAEPETSQTAPAPVENAPSPEPEPEIPAPIIEVPPTGPAEPETPSSEPVAPEPAESQTAQVPANEPLPPEPEPITLPTLTPQSPTPPPAAPAVQNARELLVKANMTKQSRKRKKLDRILDVLNTKGKITNDEVEKLLHVSDATATRYLSQLEKEGKIKQVGQTGKAVEYTRI